MVNLVSGRLVLYSGIGIVLGLLSVYNGFQAYRERQLIRDTPTSKVRSLAVGDVEVKGTAKPADEPLVSPLTHTPACVYKLEVEEEHHDDDGPDWRTVLTLDERPAFDLADGTGRVRVEPEKASLEVERERRVHVDEGDKPPGELAEWAVQHGYVDREALENADEYGIGDKLGDLLDAGSDAEHLTQPRPRDRRYTEWVLRDGEQCYVFGGAKPRAGEGSATNPENLVIEKHEGTDEFILSDRSETELSEGKSKSTAAKLLLGVGLVVGGTLGVTVGLGLF